MTISDEERRAVARWAVGSAERVLGMFEALVPGDGRPRDAIGVARAFADGEPRSRRLTRIALAAHRAGKDAGDPVGLAVARATSLAAATANIHGEDTIGTLGHILGPAAYAALARELAAAGDEAAAEDELQHAIASAPATVRELVRRVPASGPGRRRVDAIQHRLDVLLRAP